MATKRTTARLESYERRYRELARKLADIGYIASGSVAPRYNRCGTKTCRCHADPPKLHGPYFQWTAKVNGKTINRQLTPHAKPRSTPNGSLTTARPAPYSPRCATSQPKPPNSSSPQTPPTPQPRFNRKLRGCRESSPSAIHRTLSVRRCRRSRLWAAQINPSVTSGSRS